jgi:hypothetical protein
MAGAPPRRNTSTIYFASYGLSLLGQGIASVVLPLIVSGPDR